MAAPTSLVEGKSIEAPAEDLRSAQRVEQYRVSGRALYIPAGFRWNYIPFCAILEAEESHHSLTAGKCVAVTERRPTLSVKTEGGDFMLPLEKAESLKKLLALIRGERD